MFFSDEDYAAYRDLVARRKINGQRSHEYHPTSACEALKPVVMAMGEWGLCWARHMPSEQDIDVEFLMFYLERSIDASTRAAGVAPTHAGQPGHRSALDAEADAGGRKALLARLWAGCSFGNRLIDDQPFFASRIGQHNNIAIPTGGKDCLAYVFKSETSARTLGEFLAGLR